MFLSSANSSIYIYQLSQYVNNVLFYKHLFLANITPSNRPRSLTRQEEALTSVFIENYRPRSLPHRPRSLPHRPSSLSDTYFWPTSLPQTGRDHWLYRPRSLLYRPNSLPHRPRSLAEFTKTGRDHSGRDPERPSSL